MTAPSHDAVVIIDVDGVLSPDPGAAKRDGGFTDWKAPRHIPRAPEGGRYHLRLSPTMGAALDALPAEIVWLTTWGRDANRYLLDRLGWPHRRVIDWPQDLMPDGRHIDHRGKATGLAEWLDAQDTLPSRAVWIDDELAVGGRLHADGGAPNPLDDRGIDHLLVGTNPTYGLTTTQLDDLTRWLTR